MTRTALQYTSLFLLALTVTLAACASPDGPRVGVQGDSGLLEVRVEVADTPEARKRGLMWRNRLGGDEGMLFVFETEQPLSFWMKNTPVALDIIFISEAERVVSVASSRQPYSTEPALSGVPARYVLEVAAGQAARYGIGPGATATLPRGLVPDGH